MSGHVEAALSPALASRFVSDDANTPVYWRTAILVDVVLLAVGLLMISQDWWTDFAEVVVIVSVIGLPVAVWKLIQMSRRQTPGE